jgi:hypothetical protein
MSANSRICVINTVIADVRVIRWISNGNDGNIQMTFAVAGTKRCWRCKLAPCSISCVCKPAIGCEITASTLKTIAKCVGFLPVFIRNC